MLSKEFFNTARSHLGFFNELDENSRTRIDAAKDISSRFL